MSAGPSPAPNEILITLSDGTRLAADLHLPDGAGPFPVLVTFYPYRKDDFIGSSCAFPRLYFAARGYATLLVDIRGYGRSDGPACQPWDPQEARDGAEVIEWTAGQPWCDGNIGIWGTSYGGLQSLTVAAERPKALKAIACIYGGADIYHDYVFPGGCENALGVAAWNSFMVTLDLAPPGLQDPDGRWLDIWRGQLGRMEERNMAWFVWPSHRGYDEYWSSRRVPVEQIEVPTYFLSGWRDLLCRATLDAWRRCRAPKRLLAGPWSHAAPDSSVEAPYDWLSELGHWFDRWLKGAESEPARPDVVYQLQGPNSWHGCGQWPPAQARDRTFFAAPDGRAVEAPEPLRVEHEAAGLSGVEAGLWYPMGVVFANVLDQAADDARALSFTSAPLDRELIILGEPSAALALELEAGRHQLCVKLCDVGPDDRSTLISSGWLSLDAGEGGRRTAEVELYATAYHLPAGHRLRWTVTCADFPRVWPEARRGRITLVSDDEDASSIRIPVSTETLDRLARHDAPLPEPGVNRAPWVVSAKPVYERTRDVAGDSVSIKAGMAMAMRLPQGGTFSLDHHVVARISAARPEAASIRTSATLEAELASGERYTVKTDGLASIGRRHMHGRIFADGTQIFDRHWTTFNGLPLGED